MTARPTQTPGTPPTSPGGVPGPRTWTLELPAGMEVLSPNKRLHWARKAAIARELRRAAWAITRAAKVPRLDQALVTVEYQPPDRRRRDADNVPVASGKPCIDGIVDAGVLLDDSPEYIDVRYRIGPVYPRGRIVLHIAEVTP